MVVLKCKSILRACLCLFITICHTQAYYWNPFCNTTLIKYLMMKATSILTYMFSTQLTILYLLVLCAFQIRRKNKVSSRDKSPMLFNKVFNLEKNARYTHNTYNSDANLAKLISSIQTASLVYVLCWKRNPKMSCITLLLTQKSYRPTMFKHWGILGTKMSEFCV